jgi:hypothetical protein
LDAIPKTWKTNTDNLYITNLDELCKKNTKPTKFAYTPGNILIKQFSTKPIISITKWNNLIPEINLNWEHQYQSIQSTTTDTKLKMLQFKILHRTVATNYNLNKRKITPTPTCTFCDAQETIHHLFFNCPVVKPILNLLKRLVDYKTNMTVINQDIYIAPFSMV